MLDIKRLENGNLALSIPSKADCSLLQERLDNGDDEYMIWQDILEPYTCNGEYTDASGCIACWGGPILAEDVLFNEDGTSVLYGQVWAFLAYESSHEVEILASGNTVVFTKILQAGN